MLFSVNRKFHIVTLPYAGNKINILCLKEKNHEKFQSDKMIEIYISEWSSMSNLTYS